MQANGICLIAGVVSHTLIPTTEKSSQPAWDIVSVSAHDCSVPLCWQITLRDRATGVEVTLADVPDHIAAIGEQEEWPYPTMISVWLEEALVQSGSDHTHKADTVKQPRKAFPSARKTARHNHD